MAKVKITPEENAILAAFTEPFVLREREFIRELLAMFKKFKPQTLGAALAGAMAQEAAVREWSSERFKDECFRLLNMMEGLERDGGIEAVVDDGE